MASALTCPHGYGSPTSCVDCMLDGPVVAPPKPITWEPTASVRTAMYDGTCRGCRERILIGDRVRLWKAGDESSAWLHDVDDCTM